MLRLLSLISHAAVTHVMPRARGHVCQSGRTRIYCTHGQSMRIVVVYLHWYSMADRQQYYSQRLALADGPDVLLKTHTMRQFSRSALLVTQCAVQASPTHDFFIDDFFLYRRRKLTRDEGCIRGSGSALGVHWVSRSWSSFTRATPC